MICLSDEDWADIAGALEFAAEVAPTSRERAYRALLAKIGVHGDTAAACGVLPNAENEPPADPGVRR